MLIQYIAEDDARGSTDEAWDRTQALFETLGEDELIDPDLPPETCCSACSTRTACGCSAPSRCAPSAAARRSGSTPC